MQVGLVEGLLERQGELAAIDEAVERALTGEGSLLLVEGPAGIGKTELLAAARARGEAEGMQVLFARGGELERNFPFGVVRQIFEPALAKAGEAERSSLLEGAAALAGPVLGFGPVPAEPAQAASGVSGVEQGLAAQHGLYWLAANLAERAPVVVAVDDAHWADAASLRWLVYLVRRLEGLPMLVAAAVRPGQPDNEVELLSALGAEPLARAVRPTALSPLGVARLVERSLGASADDEFCAACHEATGGNPFLLGELLEAVRRDSLPPSAESAGRIRGLGPETVSRSLMLRMAGLGAGAPALARSLAILGPGCALHEAAAMADLPEPVAARATDALVAAAIFSSGRPLDFAHPIVRTAIYEQIPPAERAMAHARAARLLGQQGARNERVAAQLLAAEPSADPWVTETLRRAAQDAIARAAPDAAVAYLRRALHESPPANTRIELLQRLLTAALPAGDLNAFDGLGGDPVQELAADPDALLASASGLAIALHGGGRGERGYEVLERAIETAIARGDLDLAMQLEIELVNWLQLVPSQARARFERYRDRIEPGTVAEARWLALQAWWGSLIGDLDAGEAAELARRALGEEALWREQEETPLQLGQAILVLIRADEFELAGRWIDRWMLDARRRGSIPNASAGAWLRGYLAYHRGDVAEAESAARSAVEPARAAGFLLWFPLWLALLVDALVERGALAAADQELQLSGMTGEVPDLYWFGPVLFSRGRLRLAQGRTHEGLDDLLEQGRRYHRDGILNPRSYAAWASAAAPALASVGDAGEARRVVERELERARAWGTPGPVGAALGALGLVEGGEEGLRLLREAVAVLEPSQARLEHARAMTHLGAALRRAGHRSEARETLRKALDLAHRCGASALVEHAREELRATGAKPRRIVLSGVEALTASERRVAQLAAEGLSNKEIAQALFVTVKTVETHLGHAYQKLDITSRSQLSAALSPGGGGSPPE